MRLVYWLAEEMLAPGGGHCSMNLGSRNTCNATGYCAAIWGRLHC